MATRVTRSSARFAKPSKPPSAVNTTATSTTENRRRQRKHSESSENSAVAIDHGQRGETNVNVTPPKLGKFDPSHAQGQYSPSTSFKRMSLDETPKPKNSIDSARKILNIGETDELYGREQELTELTKFLDSNLKNKTSASMYISGQPGKVK